MDPSVIDALHTAGRPRPELPQLAIQVTLRASADRKVAPYAIHKPVTILGGRRDCDFGITHPEVSKIHCAVIHTGQMLLVCDLRSRAGTFVNDKFASLSELQPDTVLRMGSVPVAVEFADPVAYSMGAWQAAQAVRPLRLDGPHSHQLRQVAAVIGRRGNCDLVIDAPEVSLAHALLFFLDGKPAIFDLGSRSGTHVNGRPVSLCWLADGDELRIGNTTWRVTWDGPIGFDPSQVSVPAEEPTTKFHEKRQTPEDWARALPPAQPLESKPAPPSGAISETITSLGVTLADAQRRLAEKAAELERKEQELSRRAADLEARERVIRERESGELAAAAQIEHFKCALQLAQEFFATPNHRAAKYGTHTTSRPAPAPVVSSPMFGNVGPAAPKPGMAPPVARPAHGRRAAVASPAAHARLN